MRSLFDVAMKRGDVALVATGYVLSEARRNLERKAPSRISELESLLEDVAIVEEPPARLVEELAPDPGDAPVLAGAVSGEAELLAAGNERDFRELYGKEARGVLVLRPRDALDRLTP